MGRVLIRSFDGDDMRVARQVVHDANLSADVVDVLLGDKLAFGDGFASEFMTGGGLDTEAGGAELALTQDASKDEVIREGRSMALQD